MPDTTPQDAEAAASTPKTLGEFLASQKVESTGDAVARLLGYLASRGGSAFASECERAGHSEEAMVSALTDHPTDKRVKARARAEVIHGSPVLWLTTPGWNAVGQTSKKETRPTTQTLAHADAPRRLAAWLDPIAKTLTGHVSCTLTADPAAVTDVSETAKALAWASIQNPGTMDNTGGAGLLTSGFRPDALLIERWWNPNAHAGAYSLEHPLDQEIVAEITTAIEIEDTTKNAVALKAKVARLDAAISLGAIDHVLWVVRSHHVARALVPFGIGRELRPRPGHYVAAGWQVGIAGGEMVTAPKGPLWWPVRLTTAEDGAQQQPPPPRTPFGVAG